MKSAAVPRPCHPLEEANHSTRSDYPSIHWAVPAVATIFIGMSFTLVFISFLTYLVEVYLMVRSCE